MPLRHARLLLATLTVVNVKPLFGQTSPERLRITQVLAERLAIRFAAEKAGSWPCISTSPYGADSMLMTAPALTDSMSRVIAHQRENDSSRSSLLRDLLTNASADRASLDTATFALLSSLARILGKSRRTIDTIDVRELGIFSFRLEDDSAVLGLAYGGYLNTPRGDAFWDAIEYRFYRDADGWRITTDTALFYSDGRRVRLSPLTATHLNACLH